MPFRDVPDLLLTEKALRLKYAPVALGPTWRRRDDGSWVLPDLTLGWEIIGWCGRWLTDPNSGHARPWRFTPEQMRFVLWWYAVDEYGRFLYRQGVLQRLKGWGKDPLAAVLSVVEWIGPSRFSHFDESGQPVGRRQSLAHVMVAAVSQSQTDNTMSMLDALLPEATRAHYSIKPGIQLWRADGSCRIEAATSSYRSLEGGRATFIVANETHHWVPGTAGPAMWRTITNNATKMAGRTLAITNAYQPGEASVAQAVRETYEDVRAGRSPDDGTLYDSLEAPPHTPLDLRVLPVVLDLVRGDAKWLPVRQIVLQIVSQARNPAGARRMWLNQIVAEDEQLFSPADWDPLRADYLKLHPMDRIVLGFDGGKTDDGTALVAIRVADRAVFRIGYWQAPEGDAGRDWVVPRSEVDAAVRKSFRIYDVVGFYCDVSLWESHIHDWGLEFGDSVSPKVRGSRDEPFGWDMRSSLKKSTLANEDLVSAILEGRIVHDGDVLLRQHVLNVYRRENRFGVSFMKESRESPRKVDLYAALMLAYQALLDFERKHEDEEEEGANAYFLG